MFDRLKLFILPAGLIGIASLTACAPPLNNMLPGQHSDSGVFRDGTYQVGKDIAPGLYMSESDGHREYAARLDAGRNILGNSYADRVLVEVRSTDTYVEVTGTIKPWAARQPSPNTPLDGTWLVGSEWGPGTYQITPGPNGHTYWARLADVNGDTIIDNDYTSGQTYMPVDSSDKAVEVDGVWTA